MTKSQHTQTNMSTPERYCSTLQRTHSELYFENWQAEHFSKTLIIVIRFNLVQFSPSFPLNLLCKLHVPSMFWAVFFYFTQFGVQLLVEEFRDSSFEYCGTKLSLVQFLKKKGKKKKKNTLTFSSRCWLLTPILIIHTRQSIKSFSSLSSCRALVPAEDKLRTSLVAWTSTAGQGWVLFGSCPRAAAAVHSE